MSKERLEDIRFLNITEAIKCINPNYAGEYTDVNINEIVKDVEWLIEQAETLNKCAERNKELEEDYEYLSHHYGLETEQNKRLREAMKEAREASFCCGLTAGSILDEALEGEG